MNHRSESPFEMIERGVTISQDEEQRIFQKFLKTFSK